MLWLLVNIRFQVLFHSPPGVLFTFPSRYFSTIGHQVVFRLGGWSPLLPTGFHVSGSTLDPACSFKISLTGLLPSLAWLPSLFCYLLGYIMQSSTLKVLLPQVWPLPISLAATLGISFDFSSSAYLDVSVQRVFLHITILFIIWYYSIAVVGSPIRISAYLWIFAPPRSFSQLVTSFFGSWCQGIRRMLFFAWPLQKTFVSWYCQTLLRTISRSPWVLWDFMWVSFAVLFLLDTSCSFRSTFLLPFFYLKKPFLSYSFFLFSFQTSYLLRRNAWKVHSVKDFLANTLYLHRPIGMLLNLRI